MTTRGDRILVLVIAIVAVLAIPVLAAASSGQDSSQAVVTGPAGRTVLDLGVDRTIVVQGLCGDVVVEVSNGTVRVVESTCPDKVCVRSGALDSHGGVVACVPNGVTVVVGAEGERGLDAIVR
ncbi:MAG: NusG domain II-containing protein [Coriobacteriia bacterium]|nr:NusG domain II-containing protein [Coriobacteriia bacterium]